MRHLVKSLVDICPAEKHPIEGSLMPEDFFAYLHDGEQVVFTHRISSIDFDKKLMVCNTQEYQWGYDRRSH